MPNGALTAWVDMPPPDCPSGHATRCAILALFGPLVTLPRQARRRDGQDGPVGVMKHRMRDAAQHPRHHATAPAGTENDDVGVDVGRHGEDPAADFVVAIGDPRQRDESGGHSSMRAVGSGLERGLFQRRVGIVVAILTDQANPDAQRAVAKSSSPRSSPRPRAPSRRYRASAIRRARSPHAHQRTRRSR